MLKNKFGKPVLCIESTSFKENSWFNNYAKGKKKIYICSSLAGNRRFENAE